MIAQVVAILALILSSARNAVDLLWWIGQVALWVVVVAALVSAADYFRRFSLFSRHESQAESPRRDGLVPHDSTVSRDNRVA